MTEIAKKHTYQILKGLILKYRRIIVILIYVSQTVLASYLAFLLRFDAAVPSQHLRQFFSYLPYLALIRLVFYLQGGLYKDLWRYSSISDLIELIKSITLGSIIFFFAVRYLFGETGYPRSIYILDWLILTMIAGGSRLFIRVFREYMQHEYSGKRVLIIGAGDAAEMIVRDMKNNPRYNYEPIGFIDDDPAKKGRSIHGLPIFGSRDMMSDVVRRLAPEEILISISTLGPKGLREIYEYCKPFNLPIKTLPGGKVLVSQIKPISLEDLLQRDPVSTDIGSVRQYIAGKRVLVTGAGGSIGSELCRQILGYGPSKLVLFDRYENGLFAIDNELQKTLASAQTGNPSSSVVTVVGDMRDRKTLEYLFLTHSPQIVFHAAAHKHVPLMEINPLEAVKNNIFGTRNLVEASSLHNAESFVMISTDKAVNPTSIMGATKRVTEFLAISMNQTSATKFTTVRFGNVLGSNGSVVPLFKEQVKKGGPLTVTHPDIRRYFMLIPEAVQLVLIAAAAGTGGQIFVLDMGEQIRIVDLAENIIRLSGFVPNEEIRIEFTGLRPGEKLYEELFDESETVSSGSHDKLMIAVPRSHPDAGDLQRYLEELYSIVARNAVDEILPLLKKIIPNLQSASSSDRQANA